MKKLLVLMLAPFLGVPAANSSDCSCSGRMPHNPRCQYDIEYEYENESSSYAALILMCDGDTSPYVYFYDGAQLSHAHALCLGYSDNTEWCG